MQVSDQIHNVSFIPAEMSPRAAYQLLISLVVPRPIGWISSRGVDGSINLAPFSFFNAVGGNPPTVMVSISERRGEQKDTLRNLSETREFVLNVVSEELAQAMNATSGDYPYGDNEFLRAGLNMQPSSDVQPPRVFEAKAALETRVTQMLRVNGTGYTLVLGQIVRIHVRSDLVRENGTVNPELLKPLGRLGGPEYASLGQVIRMERSQVSR